MSKIDLGTAFRRLHVYLLHKLMQFTVIGDMAYFLGRMPFGSCEGPGKFDIPSNITVDLAQELINDPSWDPATLHSPNEKNIPSPETLDEDIPFGVAEPLNVDMDFLYCSVDGFVDDLTTIVLNMENWIEKARNAIALAIHVVFRPANPQDPLPREDVISIRKLLAEGKLEEIKIMLGWIIDTRRFLIKLTNDKADRWILDIRELKQRILDGKPISTTEWESLIGKYNTVAYIVKVGKFFLSHFRYRLKLSKKPHCSGFAKGLDRELDDMNFWIKVIKTFSDLKEGASTIQWKRFHVYSLNRTPAFRHLVLSPVSD